MKIKKFVWFDLKKYERSQALDSAQWAIEIGNRLLVGHLIDEQHEHLKDEVSKLIQNIKEFGLFTSIPTNPENNPLSFWSQIKTKRFVKDVTVFDALEYSYGHENKKEFELDYKVMEKLDFSEEAKADRKNLFKKYSKSLSQDYIERFDRLDELAGLDNCKNDLGDRYIKVDINASAELLMKEFESWLSEQKEKYFLNFPKKNFKKSDFTDWTKNKLLEYWDITNLAKYENVTITYDEIGRLLFPDEYGVTLSERVRKVIKPKASMLFKYEIEQALIAQTNTE